MDFPDNAATNVHKINGINHIEWTLFSLEDSHSSGSPGEERNRPSTTDTSNLQDPAHVESLQKLENELRSKGYHVLCDSSKNDIWVFHLRGPNPSVSHDDYENKMLRDICSTGIACRKLASDSLSASDLYADSVKTPNFSPSTLNSIERTNAQAFVANATFYGTHDLDDSRKVPSSPPSQDIVSIVAKMVEAISLSLLYHLAKNLSYIPLGVRSFFTSSDPGVLADSIVDRCPSHRQSTVSLISISVQWWPSGVLTISSFQTDFPELRRFFGSADEFRNLEPPKFTNMLLSPSGRTAQYIGVHQTQTHRDENKQESVHDILLSKGNPTYYLMNRTKASVTSRLLDLGIHLPQREPWLKLVNIEKHLIPGNAESLPKTNSTSGVFIWPASLCLYIEEKEPQDSLNYSNLISGGNNGPLADVESWYKEKSARQELLGGLSGQDKLNHDMKEEPLDIDEDDGLSDFVPRMNQYTSTHDANGIYPTPPDGLPMQAIVSSNPEVNLPAGEFSGRETIVSGQAHEGPLDSSPFMSTLDSVMNNATYQPQDSTDLFDEIDVEMDNELFADNVLTEADLSFFDKPDAEDDGNISEDKQNTLVNNESLEATFEQSNHDFIDKAFAEDQMDSVLLGRNFTEEGALFPRNSAVEFRSDLLSDKNEVKGISLSNRGDSILHQNQFQPAPQEQIFKRDGINQIKDIMDIEGQDKRSFQSISFEEKLQKFDDKYKQQGRFGYEIEGRGTDIKELVGPDISGVSENVMFRDISLRNSRGNRTPSDLETDGSADESNGSISEISSQNMISHVIKKSSLTSSRKRKRGQTESVEDSTSPISLNHSSTPNSESSNGSESFLLATLLKPNGNSLDDSSLSTILWNLQPRSSKYVGNGRNFIQVAQILVDQLVLQTEFTTETSQFSLDHSWWWNPTSSDDSTYEAILRLFPENKKCSLKDFVSIEGGAFENPVQEVITGRQSQRDQQLSSRPRPLLKAQPNVVKLPAPYTCIRRNHIQTEVLAPALHFWEELGLEPSHGDKDIIAACVCPAISSIQQGVGVFLNMLGSTYQSCKLGNHNPAPDSAGYSNGIVPVAMGDGNFINMMDKFNQACESIGTNIGHLNVEGGNTVIYMINPFKNSQAIPYLCSASLKIFETYALALKARQCNNPNDLILQIIPLDFITTSNTLALPSPLAYRSLAFEIYDRCPPNISSHSDRGSQFACAPSIQLGRAIPKMINLSLSSEPSASLLHSDMCLHLAYAWDPSHEWLTASWTDNRGNVQWNTPYCLGVAETEECWPIFLGIIRDIWETTLEMLYPRNSTWRLYVAKDRAMHKRELEAWLSVISQPSLPTTTCTFLTVESNPPLQFPCPLPSEKMDFVPPNAYNTPNSTPAAHTASPDTSALVSTPSGNPPSTPTTTGGLPDGDIDAKLIDITDESWSLVLPFPSIDPLLSASYCLPLASGYLLKRAGTRDEDGLTSLGVNFVHGDIKGKEAALKEVLSMYRGLAALARIRGVVDRVRGMLPWHIAAARKAGNGVNSLMSWDGE